MGRDQDPRRERQVAGADLSRPQRGRARAARSGQRRLLRRSGSTRKTSTSASCASPTASSRRWCAAVKLYTKETPLFEQFGIQDEINHALKSKVWLKSGGYIVINQTEALVAIDVNTGKYVGKTQRLEDTIVKTNVDAIKEIVRQIRLRDLGGIIVIDFIDMDERKNRQKVMQALEEALRSDRAPSKVLQFNDFGLVAITRKRVKQSLERTSVRRAHIAQARAS